MISAKICKDYKLQANQFIESHSKAFINISKAIWSYSELAFQEYKSFSPSY